MGTRTDREFAAMMILRKIPHGEHSINKIMESTGLGERRAQRALKELITKGLYGKGSKRGYYKNLSTEIGSITVYTDKFNIGLSFYQLGMYIEEEILGKFDNIKDDREMAMFFLKYMFYQITPSMIVALEHYQGLKEEKRLRNKYITLTVGIEKLSEALRRLLAKEDGVWKAACLEMFKGSVGGAIVSFEEFQKKRKFSLDEIRANVKDLVKSSFEDEKIGLDFIKRFIGNKAFDKHSNQNS